MKNKLVSVQILPHKVLLATPKLTNGSLSMWYSDSIINTIRMGNKINIDIDVTYLYNDALGQKVRNDLIKIALEKNVDDLIWINSDMYWKPEWIFQLLNYDVDVVGGIYSGKSEIEKYNIIPLDNNIIKIDSKTGLFEIKKIELGFLKISKRVLISLRNDPENIQYQTKDNAIGKWIFEVILDKNGRIIEEDEIFCNKLSKLGYKIYLDPNMTCDRIGFKRYSGNFINYIESKKIKINELK